MPARNMPRAEKWPRGRLTCGGAFKHVRGTMRAAAGSRTPEPRLEQRATSPETINGLLSKVAQGNRDAFRALYRATSAKLFGICLRILKDKTEAEEALQEVYVRIWQKAKMYRPGKSNPLGWLAAIARNHAIDVIRAKKPVADDIEEAYAVSDDAPSPERQAVVSDEMRRVDLCMEELDDRHAGAVRRAYVDGYSYEELASKYEVPLNTMRTWLRRSLIKLRACLEQ